MATADPILNALARMEERLLERMEKWRREIRLDLEAGFDAVNKRLDRLVERLQEIERRLPPA